VRDVNLLAATDSSNYAHMHEELFAGISLNVQSKLISAGQGLADAGSTLGGSNSLYGLAPTALAAKRAYEAVKALGPLNELADNPTRLGAASITAGFSYQKTTQTAATTTPVVTQLRSGGSTSIVAQDGSITSHGAQIVAGYDAKGQVSTAADAGNILLSAGKDINLSSVQSTSTANSTSTSASAGLGVGVSVGTDFGSGPLVGNAAFGNGKVKSTASGQTNTHVIGTGTVALNSGNDTTLKGAVVSGTSVIANVGHDLTIESVQDKATYRDNSTSIGGGFGAGGASASANKGTIKGDYANVSEQSGIVAGSGGYHIAVGNGVDLKAGVITSTADKDKNSLSADHLTYSDLENTSRASSSSMGVGIGTGKDGKLGLPTPIIGQPAKEEDRGKALATLTPGNLTLAHQSQDLSGLNTDASKANTQVSPLDIKKLKAKQQSAAALSQLLNESVGDLALKLNLPPNSPIRTILHGFAGAAVSAATGGNIGTGALSGAVSELANVALQDVLKANPNISEADKAAITQWVATAVGAAVGGQAGAAAALDNVTHNYLTHEQLEKAQAANRKLRDCIESNQCTTVEMAQAASDVAQYKAISQSNTRDLIATCSANGGSEACRAKIDDLIRFTDETADVVYDPKNDHASPYVFAAGNIYNLDNYLASYLKEAKTNGTDTQAALQAGLSAYTRKEGGTKAVLDALGVVAGGAVCASGVGTGACIAAVIGTAATSGSHLYGDVQQVITGQEAKSALVQALISQGVSPEKAEKYQSYVDTGVIIVTAGAGGVKFAVNKLRAGAAADDLASLAGKPFDVEDVLPNQQFSSNVGLLKPLIDPANNLASDTRTTHILYGDATGGGHLWPGGLGKTPFPQTWDGNKVMKTVSEIATDPNLSWKAQTGTGGL
jgi:hypothetical protein